MVCQRIIPAQQNVEGASTTDDGSSSMQRSARRAIARSWRAALENYEALISQITQITEDEPPSASVQRSKDEHFFYDAQLEEWVMVADGRFICQTSM
jgi:hypothetical protein